MNKFARNTIIITGLLFVGLIAFLIWREVASYHTLTVKNEGKISLTFYQLLDGKKVNEKNITQTTDVSVKNGLYCAASTDSNYDNSPVCIDVDNKDTTLMVAPAFSTSYLVQLLTSELQSQLSTLITNKYSAIISRFVIDKGELFDRGEWYGTTLTVKTAPQDRGDVYRLILKKDGDTWSIVATPHIILSKYDYKDIPFAILTAVNQLPGTPN